MPEAIEAAAVQAKMKITEQKQRRAKADGGDKLRANLERKKRRAWEAYLDEIIDKAEYARTAADIDAQLAAIPEPETIDEDAPRLIRETLPEGWQTVYSDLDQVHRRAFWQQMVERIDIMQGRDIRVTLAPGGYAFTTQIQQPDGYWIEVVKEKE
jgi:hypothetical protein